MFIWYYLGGAGSRILHLRVWAAASTALIEFATAIYARKKCSAHIRCITRPFAPGTITIWSSPVIITAIAAIPELTLIY